MELEFTLIVICVVLVLLPPKWDPAIRIKEWLLRRRERAEEIGSGGAGTSGPDPRSTIDDARRAARPLGAEPLRRHQPRRDDDGNR